MRKFEPRIVGEKQRVIRIVFGGFGCEQRAIERHARVEVARGEIEVHFHARTFVGNTAASASSRRLRTPAASE